MESLARINAEWMRGLVLILFFGPCSFVVAQNITLDNLPPSVANTRFFANEYPVKNPSLSLNGFDCASNCAFGYGLKQIVEEAYSGQPGSELVEDVLRDLRDLAQEPYNYSPAFVGDVRANSQRLQARGLIALLSYVLTEEGEDPTSLDPELPSAGDARGDFRTALLDFGSWAIDLSLDPEGDAKDALKWSTSVANVARAIDLYLALENAYKHYDVTEYNDVNSVELLSESEKDDLLLAYTLLIDDLEHLGGEYGGFAGVDAYDVQAGNWPLKVQVAIGYALLTWQDRELLLHARRTATSTAG